jgi:hypothetical protein
VTLFFRDKTNQIVCSKKVQLPDGKNLFHLRSILSANEELLSLLDTMGLEEGDVRILRVHPDENKGMEINDNEEFYVEPIVEKSINEKRAECFQGVKTFVVCDSLILEMLLRGQIDVPEEYKQADVELVMTRTTSDLLSKKKDKETPLVEKIQYDKFLNYKLVLVSTYNSYVQSINTVGQFYDTYFFDDCLTVRDQHNIYNCRVFDETYDDLYSRRSPWFDLITSKLMTYVETLQFVKETKFNDNNFVFWTAEEFYPQFIETDGFTNFMCSRMDIEPSVFASLTIKPVR